MSDYAHNIFSYFSINKISCGYSLETPRRGVSNEYSQHIFVGEIKKNYQYFLVDKSTLSGAMFYIQY